MCTRIEEIALKQNNLWHNLWCLNLMSVPNWEHRNYNLLQINYNVFSQHTLSSDVVLSHLGSLRYNTLKSRSRIQDTHDF